MSEDKGAIEEKPDITKNVATPIRPNKPVTIRTGSGDQPESNPDANAD